MVTSEPKSRFPKPPPMRSSNGQRALGAAIAATLGFVAAEDLGLVTALGMRRLLDWNESMLIIPWVIASALLATSRSYGWISWVIPGAVAVLYLGVGYTPVFDDYIRLWLVRDTPSPADAIVVLSSNITPDGHLDTSATTRLLAGIDLARRGFASVLIRTDLPDPIPDDNDDASALVDARVEVAVVGPVASTRDEAVVVRAFAEERGLRRLILVTQPLHMRRAAATFRNVGLEVVACPSPERAFSLPQLSGARDRVQAFNQWVTELAAWQLYSWRGWVGGAR